MIGESNVGLLFQIKAEDKASEVISKLSKTVQSETSAIGSKGSAELDKLTGSSGRLSGAFAGLANPATLAATAVAAVGAAGLTAALGLFSLAKSASDYGSNIKDASEKTGLSAKSISSLKFAADQSGSSLDQISTSVARFSRLIGESAQGNEKATATLTRFGIDPKKAVDDLDGSLSTVIKTIYELPPGVQQATAAQQAFGRAGADLIPVINTTKGDFAAFTKEAERLGATLTDADVEAADKFGDALQELKTQASITALQFAKEFMPQIVSAIREVSRILIDNKGTVKTWGEATGTVIEAATRVIRGIENAWLLAHAAAQLYTTGVVTIPEKFLKGPERVVDERQGVSIETPPPNSAFTTDSDAAEDAKKAAEKAEKEREKARQVEAKAQIDFNNALAEGERQKFEKAQDVLISNLKLRGITQDEFNSEFIASESKFILFQLGLIEREKQIERGGLKNKTALAANREQEKNEKAALVIASDARIKKAQDLIVEVAKKEEEETKKVSEKRLTIAENEVNRQLELNRAGNLKKLAEIARFNSESKQFAENRVRDELKIAQEAIETEIELNKRLLANPDLKGEKRAEVNQRIALLDLALQTQKINGAIAVKEAIEEDTKAAIEAAAAFNKLLDAVTDANLRLDASRSRQKRSKLENNLENSSGKGRLKAIEDLRLFDIKQSDERLDREIKALEKSEAAEKANAEKSIVNKEKAAAAKYEIELKYDALIKESRVNAGTENTGINRNANLAASGATAGEAAGFLGESILTDLDEAGNRVTKLSGVFTELKDIAGSALSGLAQGIGSMVKNLVLLGNAGGQSFRKLTAELLASVAQQAAVIAVMELAYGFAALTPWGAAIYGSPTLHFKAAALMGSVAAIAGAAGRIAAGNSFQSGAGGSAASSSFKQQTASGNFDFRTDPNNSSGNDRDKVAVREEDRFRRPQEVVHKHVVEIQTKDSHIVNTVQDNIDNRGQLHGLLIKYVER